MDVGFDEKKIWWELKMVVSLHPLSKREQRYLKRMGKEIACVRHTQRCVETQE